MLDKPDLQDKLLITHLFDAYGLRAAQLAFLPLGADVNTAVYRVRADDGRAYFLMYLLDVLVRHKQAQFVFTGF